MIPLSWVDSTLQAQPGGNSQAGISALGGGWIVRPRRFFATLKCYDFMKTQRANCLALRGPSPWKPLFNTKAKLLGLFLSVGHCTSEDAFQASFSTKSRWCKPAFNVNICIFMAKGPHTYDYLLFCCCWLNCALIFTASLALIRLITHRDITVVKETRSEATSI